MEKKRQKGILWYVSLGLAVAGGIGLGYQGLLWIVALALTHGTGSGSLGVIGGADGPTAVYITGASGPAWDLLAAGIMLAAGIAGCIYFGKKRR